MADFPSSPTVGQIYTLGSLSWQWNGVAWDTAPLTAMPQEPAVNNGGAATGTLDIDVLSANVHFYGTSTASTGTFVLNFRGNSTTTLNSAMSQIPSVVLMTVINKTGATTASYPTSIQIDGTTTGVTTIWQGGSAPTGGNASSWDTYNFEITKTAASTYVVMASQTKYA